MSDLASQLARLASPARADREPAAIELYKLGRALGEAAVVGWRSDAEFATLLTGAPTVGIAVLPATFDKIRAANGAPRLAQVPPDQDAKEFDLHFGPRASLDVLTTREPGGKGAIARFLEKFGEGIQQVEFVVTDVDRVTEILRTRFGQQPIYPQTRPGADGTRVNFFLCSTPDGKKVLIELVESPRKEGA